MKHTDETKKKLSEMRKGEKNPFFGKKHTAETREKLSKNMREYGKNRQYAISRLTVVVPSGVTLGYFSGLVDGEGSITFQGPRPVVVIYNSCRSMMNWLADNIGGSVRWDVDKRGRVPGHVWSVASARNTYALCTAMLPLLTAKKESAEKVIIHLEAKYGDRLKDFLV